jgi:hypothetical protein
MRATRLYTRGRGAPELPPSAAVPAHAAVCKNVPSLIMYGYERASLLPREPGEGFYKTAADHFYSRDCVMRGHDTGGS